MYEDLEISAEIASIQVEPDQNTGLVKREMKYWVDKCIPLNRDVYYQVIAVDRFGRYGHSNIGKVNIENSGSLVRRLWNSTFR